MASTSSAYGADTAMPLRETDAVATPLNICAATMMACETIGHSYAHLRDQPVTMVRFFTVHGPWDRPDMALFESTDVILRGRTIDIDNHGRMKRDFTDLVEAIDRPLPCSPAAGQAMAPCDSISPVAPFRVVNIGNAQPVRLLDVNVEIERVCGRPAIRNLTDRQPGEVPRTWADASLLKALTGHGPSTGIADFVT